jgi:hypothetical protein
MPRSDAAQKKTAVQVGFEVAGVIAGSLVGAAALYWALVAQDDARVLMGALMLSPLAVAMGGAVGEKAYQAARSDR